MLFFLFPMYVCAQQQITGKVTDVRGEPIPGVGVSAMTDGQRFNAVTTSTGDYSIKVANNTKQLTFSYIGMTSQTETINGRTVVNVQLSEESRELQSVVVTALGIKREAKALSYSRQSMDVSTLTRHPLQILFLHFRGGLQEFRLHLLPVIQGLQE